MHLCGNLVVWLDSCAWDYSLFVCFLVRVCLYTYGVCVYLCESWRVNLCMREIISACAFSSVMLACDCSMCICFCLSVYVFVWVRMYVFVRIWLSYCAHVCLYVRVQLFCLGLCLSVCVYMCGYTWLSVFMCLRVSMYLCGNMVVQLYSCAWDYSLFVCFRVRVCLYTYDVCVYLCECWSLNVNARDI
jgi:hypothetical protein